VHKLNTATGVAEGAFRDDLSAEPIFRVNDLRKIYKMGEVEVHALRGVDLDLYQSELVVLLGASGSGKSTLLNILGGLDVPTSGSVRYLDEELANYNETQRTHFRLAHVGFIFQFYNLIPSLTARWRWRVLLPSGRMFYCVTNRLALWILALASPCLKPFHGSTARLAPPLL